MEKRTLVTTHGNPKVKNIGGEMCMEIEYTGISLTEYTYRGRRLKPKSVKIFIPLYAIPAMMREQRQAIAEYETKQKEMIDRLKKAYNTEIQPVK